MDERPGVQAGRPPRVWVLIGHRLGDNAQLRALAAATGWPVEEKELDWRRPLPVWTPFYGRRASLSALAPAAAATLAPPWPDIVLSIGWRSVPVALWIKARSGARLVHVGRPRAPLRLFDLVLTTPQYDLPPAPNLHRLDRPLGLLRASKDSAEAQDWGARLAALPRPWIAVLLGGSAPPLRLTAEEGARLGASAAALARARGGSLLVVEGPRTGQGVLDGLRGALDCPAYLHGWGQGSENPYRAFLGLADGLVVTSDSVSMMYEASLQGRPLWIFELPRRLAALDRVWRPLGQARPLTLLAEAARREGWAPAPRRAEAVVARLVAEGRAVRLGETADAPSPAVAPDPMATALTLLRALVGDRYVRAPPDD